MMESGEAYMQMEQMVAARPQKSFRPCPCSASSDTSTTAVNTAATPDARPSIRSRVFRLDANARKITTYTISITDPAPLIVDTRMLFGDTNGRPYLQMHFIDNLQFCCCYFYKLYMLCKM
jgi:hypothetical protein